MASKKSTGMTGKKEASHPASGDQNLLELLRLTESRLRELQEITAGLGNRLAKYEEATSAAIPIGAIVAFAGHTEPDGWLFCDGRELRSKEYRDLFNVIGTAYGSRRIGTFRLPDLQGRVTIGAGQARNLSMRTVGESLGAETHLLLGEELPRHTHTMRGHNHRWTRRGDPSGIDFGRVERGDQGTFWRDGSNVHLGSPLEYYTAMAGREETDPPNYAEDGAPISLMQPSLVVQYLIKVR